MADRESLIEVSIRGDANLQSVVNVFHIMGDVTGPAPPAPYSLSALAVDVMTRWQASILATLCDTYRVQRYILKTIVGISLQVIGGVPRTRRVYGEQFELVNTGPQFGTRPGPGTPSFVAYTARTKTALAGKSFRGSKRMGPIAEADTVNDELSGAFIPVAQSPWNNFAVLQTTIPPESLPYRYVVFGARRGILTGLVAPPFRVIAPPFNSCPVNINVGSQVSRKAKALVAG